VVDAKFFFRAMGGNRSGRWGAILDYAFTLKWAVACVTIILVDVIFQPGPDLPFGLGQFFENFDTDLWMIFLIGGVGMDFVRFLVNNYSFSGNSDRVPTILREPLARNTQRKMYPIGFLATILAPLILTIFLVWDFLTFKDLRK
jgi:hypothetical protein